MNASPRLLAAALAALGLAAAAPAGAGAQGLPTMPLANVAPGMHCTVYSVLRGTTISTFDADVVDVVGSEETGEGPRILIRVSGPAIDATGVGPGFSGSPILCPGADGVQREIGAISESTGDQTNHLVLATPIEAILSEPLTPRDRARVSSRRVRSGRPLEALSVTGVSPWLADAMQAGAKRAGRTLFAAPVARVADFAPVDLQPGSAVAVGIASGDIDESAIGTVAYRDGSTIWAFGHADDDAGARSLLLQDAYVYSIIDTPGDSGGSFKYSAPGHSIGTLFNDADNAVVGQLGALPRTFPLDVSTHDADRGGTTHLHLDVTDESALSDPAGDSSLRLAGTTAVVQAATVDGVPNRQTATMCVRITLRRRKAPLGFCDRYLTDGHGSLDTTGIDTGPAVAGLVGRDFDAAIAAIDGNTFANLAPERVSVSLTLHRGLSQGYLLAARAPRRVRRGRRIAVKVAVRQFRGPITVRTLHVRVPRSLRPGGYLLAISGKGLDEPSSPPELADLFGSIFSGGSGPQRGVTSMPELAARISAIHHFDGLRLDWISGEGTGSRRGLARVPVASERISGATGTIVRVVKG